MCAYICSIISSSAMGPADVPVFMTMLTSKAPCRVQVTGAGGLSHTNDCNTALKAITLDILL